MSDIPRFYDIVSKCGQLCTARLNHATHLDKRANCLSVNDEDSTWRNKGRDRVLGKIETVEVGEKGSQKEKARRSGGGDGIQRSGMHADLRHVEIRVASFFLLSFSVLPLKGYVANSFSNEQYLIQVNIDSTILAQIEHTGHQ